MHTLRPLKKFEEFLGEKQVESEAGSHSSSVEMISLHFSILFFYCLISKVSDFRAGGKSCNISLYRTDFWFL